MPVIPEESKAHPGSASLGTTNVEENEAKGPITHQIEDRLIKHIFPLPLRC